ncbi:hypothetical protein RCH10_000778 [Variovorax sp. GrIS 2.14]|uniref:DUF2829 domain-containing protein n=1 Tax=Variovorax sp. GrIS 2.14 TaxID=3071709 RepID=UPI0038F5E574
MNNAIDKIIIPTVGRQVWFTPNKSDPLHDEDPAPFAATVARVFAERCVNLMVLNRQGKPVERTSVLLKQAGMEYEPLSSFCEWMPYQIGQAAATPMTAAIVRTLIKEALDPGSLYDAPGIALVAIDNPVAIGSPAPFMGRRQRERNAAHDRANETLVRNLHAMPIASVPPDVGYEATGRNELYEGLFDGESDGDRAGRLARAALGLSPTSPVVDVMEDGVWVAGSTGGFMPADAAPNVPGRITDPVPLAFSVALEVLKEGAKVARLGWNGKGLWLELQVPDAHSKITLPYIFMSYPTDAANTPGARVPWLASQTDLLADDWVLVA